MNNLINMLLQQNPQLQALINQFSNPQAAKQQVMEMINSGQVTKNDIQQVVNISKQFGLEQQINDALGELDLSKVREQKNRW